MRKSNSMLFVVIFCSLATFFKLATARAAEKDLETFPEYQVTSVMQSTPYSDIFFLWNLNEKVGTLSCKDAPGSLIIDETGESYEMPSQRACRDVARSLIAAQGAPRLILLSRLGMSFMSLANSDLGSK
jgi:hypothetical protein